jgi:predicted nucleic acid-binding protein
MNGTKIVFDTCAVVKLLKGEYELSSLGFDSNDTRQFISVITRMELLAKPDIMPQEEQAIRNFLADVIVAPLDELVENKAVEIRRSAKLKLPDSIVAATAVILDAVLLTADSHLLKLSWPDFRKQNIL